MPWKWPYKIYTKPKIISIMMSVCRCRYTLYSVCMCGALSSVLFRLPLASIVFNTINNRKTVFFLLIYLPQADVLKDNQMIWNLQANLFARFLQVWIQPNVECVFCGSFSSAFWIEQIYIDSHHVPWWWIVWFALVYYYDVWNQSKCVFRSLAVSMFARVCHMIFLISCFDHNLFMNNDDPTIHHSNWIVYLISYVPKMSQKIIVISCKREK